MTMLLSLLAGVAALAVGIQAQSATATSSAAATTHSVAVGAEGFKFSPNQITDAAEGDIIEFRFYPTGHAVVRGGFKNPCIPYEYTGPNKVGFFSGFQEVQTISNNGPTFQVRVNDTTEPIFFYCAAPGSCIDQHMIGVINPNSTWTLAIQTEFVNNATTQLTPGEPFPSETASGTATPSATSTGSAGADSDSDSHHHGNSLSSGAIAGIAIGGAAVVVLAGALIYLCGRRGGLDLAYHRQSKASLPAPMMEAKFTPKSPGQETFATTQYSTPPGNDPYRQGAQSPPMHPGHYSMTGSPPPISPGHQSQYNPYPSPGFNNAQNSPLMHGVDGSTMGSQGYYMPQQTPPPHQQHPVELPTSHDPGNSPLPVYSQTRQYSWSQGGESQYRPSGKP